VIPQIINALLARHNMILQDCAGSKEQDSARADPRFRQRDSSAGGIGGERQSACANQRLWPALIEEKGDEAPITWVGRDARYVEKHATPDVTIADIIGDLDPIKAARGGHLLSDELTIHYGLLPRANRGIFRDQ
jgi:magnesium chelatase subunit I